MAISKMQKKRNATIDQIVQNQGSEANSYTPIKNILCDSTCGIGLNVSQVMVDSPLTTGSRPDISIWLDVPDAIRNENEHLYAVIEAKPHDQVMQKGPAIANEKGPLYRRSRLRHLWLLDAIVIERYDFASQDDMSIPTPQRWYWADLTQEEAFDSCFTPLMGDRPTLINLLRDFTASDIPELSSVGTVNRKEFIDSVVTVARIISRAVTELVDTHLIPDLEKALALIVPIEATHGKPDYDWYSPDEYLLFPNEPEDLDELHVFNQAYAHLIEDLEPYNYALRAETQQLRHHAERSGLKFEDVSFLKNNDNSKAGREAFIQETASLLLSRLLMLRFSEDHGLLTRYLSNGGLASFAKYAEHFKKPYQVLVKEAYDNAKPLYHHLFERKTLDWIIERDDQKLGMELLHAMWILARWDFKTVRGDILSGVYDKYLEPTQRKRLGEVYTRPELARYMLEACRWDKTKTIMDPACGTGTFLVEAFDMSLRAAENSGLGFDMDDAIDLLQQIHGLDLNEFSATLAKIQLLWHVLASAKGDQSKRIRQAIRLLKIEGGHSSLDTWGIPMESMFGQRGFDYAYSTRRKSLKASDRRFRNISTLNDHFDVIVGNPPYVRVHRVNMSEDTSTAFNDVSHKQTDLSAYFVYRTLKWWLKPGGRMAFILPLALSEAAYAEKLRALLEQYRILEVVDLELLGNVAFHGANIVTMILVVEKVPARAGDQVKLTTLDETCYDPVTGLVDMSKAASISVDRAELSLKNYLPVNEIQGLEDDDDDGVSSNALLTKIKEADHLVLKRLSSNRRLSAIIQTGFETKDKKHQRVVEIPPGSPPELWKPKLVMGYGVKIGGTPPQHTDGWPILKGGDTFPDSVDGSPMGKWNGDSKAVDTVRFYGWSFLMDLERAYAFREISLAPTVAPHPANTYLQNTVYIVQLREKFPLNVYMLSRVVRWYMLKTARASVMSGSMRAHWFPRNLLRIPIPEHIWSEFVDNLNSIGTRLFELDRELMEGNRIFGNLINLHSNAKALRHRAELVDSGLIVLPDPADYPPPGANWAGVMAVEDADTITFQLPTPGELFSGLAARTQSGRPCTIKVKDPQLLRWFVWVANTLLANDKLPSQSWARNLPIPDDIDATMELLDRVEQNQARKDIEAALDHLDILVAYELEIDEGDRDYIVEQMKTDRLLSKLHPAWRHSAGRRKEYIAYGSTRGY